MERDREAAHGHSEAEEDEGQHMQAQEPGAPVEVRSPPLERRQLTAPSFCTMRGCCVPSGLVRRSAPRGIEVAP